MFKELGAFIDACGRFTAGTIRISANMIKNSMEGSVDRPPMTGCIEFDDNFLEKSDESRVIDRASLDETWKFISSNEEDVEK